MNPSSLVREEMERIRERYTPRCVFCKQREVPNLFAGLCDPCLDWLQKPWWRRGRRP